MKCIDLDAGKDWRQKEKGMTEDEMLGCHHWHQLRPSTQWTWVWASSRSWWWTWKPGMLQSMGLKGVGHNWETELIGTRKGFPGGSAVKNLPAMQEMWVWSLGQEDSLEKETATHSSILAWEIPRTEKTDGLQSMEFSRILEWVAFPFSRGCSQPRVQTQVSHIAGRFFTSWATREAQ